MGILDLLRDRTRARGQTGNAGGVRTGVVIGTDGNRYTVNDGFSTLTCESVVTTKIRQGDRVWFAEGRGISVILGTQGPDINFGGV